MRLRGLYAITDGRHSGTALDTAVDSVLRGGARIIQYRDKHGSPETRTQDILRLHPICRRYDALLIINDDVHLAAYTRADGVHLGADDMDIEAARDILGPGAVIGVSCYDDLPRAVQMQQRGADYVAFGSFYPSQTKPAARRADISLLVQARAALRLPIAVIGGITPENAAVLVGSGADMLAVITGVFAAPDPEAAARRYQALFSN